MGKYIVKIQKSVGIRGGEQFDIENLKPEDLKGAELYDIEISLDLRIKDLRYLKVKKRFENHDR